MKQAAQNNDITRTLTDNLAALRRDIETTARTWQRPPGAVQLIAVSKKQPAERIDAALAAGLRIFGENRVQEAQERWTARRADYPDLYLHLVGPLQTNKVSDAVALFDCIQTLDRDKLARKLAAAMAEQDRRLPCFIQVNTGDEQQKSGITPEALADFHDYAVHECGLQVTGLMCIPPRDEPPALHFALLRKKARERGLAHLSMGMSGDYQRAIAAGATHIRIGSALFGPRGV